MKYNKIKTKLLDSYIIDPVVFPDDRGSFVETYWDKDLPKFVVDNQSFNKLKGTVRGLHTQMNDNEDEEPHSQAKLVRVAHGAVLDVIVDVRAGSPTYGEQTAVYLSGENHRQLYVPRGFLHGYITLEDNTTFLYKVDNYYYPNSGFGVNFLDKDLDIEALRVLGDVEPIFSGKDKTALTFKDFEFKNQFTYKG